jgi:hypothetical protein
MSTHGRAEQTETRVDVDLLVQSSHLLFLHLLLESRGSYVFSLRNQAVGFPFFGRLTEQSLRQCPSDSQRKRRARPAYFTTGRHTKWKKTIDASACFGYQGSFGI